MINSKEKNIDILSLILSEDKNLLKDIVLKNPQVATENNFLLLTLACWCCNYDILNFLISDHLYFLEAFENKEFYEQFQKLKLFNLGNYQNINQKYQSLLLSVSLSNSIPINYIETSISKF